MQLREGSKVEHLKMKEWGIGVLLEDVEGENVRIRFENAGVKRINVTYIIKTDRDPSIPFDNSTMLRGAVHESVEGFPTHAFIYCKKLDRTSFLLITKKGEDQYNLRSLDNGKWRSAFKAPDIIKLEEFFKNYPIEEVVDATENAASYGVVENRRYWQREIKKLNEKYNISER
jgi:hypothetical protein